MVNRAADRVGFFIPLINRTSRLGSTGFVTSREAGPNASGGGGSHFPLLALTLLQTALGDQLGQSLKVFPAPFAHQTDLDPISLEQIAAVATQEITGAAQLGA